LCDFDVLPNGVFYNSFMGSSKSGPKVLLTNVQRRESRRRLGNLKILSEAANGVGKSHVYSLLIVTVCTIVAWIMLPYFDLANLIMVYLVGNVVIATRYGRGPSVLAAILSVLAFDFFFVPPSLNFEPRDAGYIVTLVVMLLVALTISNMTIRIKEQAEAVRERERRIEAERMRNSLLSSMSHDLRTPLASIIGATTGLLRHQDKLDAHAYELAQIAHEESERLDRWVGNLLQMTRLESGNVQVEKEWQPLEEVVGTTLLRLEERLAYHPMEVDLPNDLPLVLIDAVLIEQVLVNLLENAVKYTAPGSPVDLSAQAEGQQVIVEVADRGPGLPPGEEERIFDKFYRVHQTDVGGFGLGLTICKAIVELHGGSIWAANRAGGGAVFYFTLPLEGEPPQVKGES
jgi:two-component system, OmpR family, sensor histidine kinase KdpD